MNPLERILARISKSRGGVKAVASEVIDSPIGRLTIHSCELGIVSVDWDVEATSWVQNGSDSALNRDKNDVEWLQAHVLATSHASLAKNQLREYFNGSRKQFDLPLIFEGTSFQKAIWEALLEIPFGETRSYAQIAERVGNPKAVRAVGQANRANPIAVVIPCHRVIGANGSLVGYAGSQVDLKSTLLNLERSHHL